MIKEECSRNRIRIKCPICGKEITKANYKRHYDACNNSNSKLNKKKQGYKVNHELSFAHTFQESSYMHKYQ